jgi:hypothetical protein
MPTPFDSALRVQRRALDAIRLSLLAEAVREAEVRAHLLALDQHIADEQAVAAGDWRLAAHPYGARLRDHAARLDGERAGIDASLSGLRDAALVASGQMQAVADAAGAYRASLARASRASEQNDADEIFAARAARALRTTPHRALRTTPHRALRTSPHRALRTTLHRAGVNRAPP